MEYVFHIRKKYSGESERNKHMGQVQLSGALFASPEQPGAPPPAQKRKTQRWEQGRGRRKRKKTEPSNWVKIFIWVNMNFINTHLPKSVQTKTFLCFKMSIITNIQRNGRCYQKLLNFMVKCCHDFFKKINISRLRFPFYLSGAHDSLENV